MNDYTQYEAEDLLLDDSFRQWATGASLLATTFWEQWLRDHPERAGVVWQARSLVLALNEQYQDDLTEGQINADLSRLVSRAADRRDGVSWNADRIDNAEETSTVEPRVIPFGRNRWLRVSVAASVLVMMSVGAYYSLKTSKPYLAVYKKLIRTAPVALREQVNSGDQAVNVLLKDGSVVTLSKNSRLSYPAQFNGSTRTVYLSGEAFFDVVKNPDQPFLVYANETVTKVLGTSFLVRAFATCKRPFKPSIGFRNHRAIKSERVSDAVGKR